MYSDGKKKKPLLFRNLRKRYHLRIQDEQSLHDKLFLRISKARIYVFAITGLILISGITFLLIAYTNLRKMIPGYVDADIAPMVYDLERRADSLEFICEAQSKYLDNLRLILSGENMSEEAFTDSNKGPAPLEYAVIENILYTRSREDSLLRLEFDTVSDYTLLDRTFTATPSTTFRSENFIIPILGGILSNRFSRVERHYGIDLIGKTGVPVLSTLDGTIIFSEWTVETGYVIVVQHRNDLISIYKHNSSLLKRSGDYVKAGDPIAIIGNTGSITSGIHLHFEIWYKGSPLNPEDYLIF